METLAATVLSIGEMGKAWAEGQYEEQNESAEPAGFGLFGEVPDDEQHEQHEAAQPEGQAKLGNLFFC